MTYNPPTAQVTQEKDVTHGNIQPNTKSKKDKNMEPSGKKTEIIINPSKSDIQELKSFADFVLTERGDFWHPDPEQDRKLGGPGANQRAREDRAAASKPKADPKKLRPGESYLEYSKRQKYGESYVPGKPAERLGAVTAIPKDERDAARERLLAKTKAAKAAREKLNDSYEVEDYELVMELTGGKGHPGYKAGSRDHGPMQSGHSADTFKRTMKGGTMSMRHGDHLGDLDDKDDDEGDLEAGLKDTARKRRENVRKPLRDVVKAARKRMTKEDYELVDEAIRNPESRKKLRDIEDKEVRKGDTSKGENPRSKYSTFKGKLAGHLLRGPESTGSKGNPVRSRGGTNAPADERVGRGPHRAGNAAYWAGNAGPNRDRGAGNKAARRAGKSVPNTRDMDENYDLYDIILSHPLDEGKVELKQRNKGEMQRKAGNLGREVVSTPNTKKNAAKRGAAMDRMKKLVSAIARDDEEKRFKTIGQSPLHNSYEMEEGLDKKTFLANRKKNERKAATADARKRGHEGHEWHNTGRTYSPDEAKSRRANMSDDDRAARHRVAVDPDDDRDENTYSASKTKNPKKQRKQAAMGEMMTFSDFMESRRSEREGKGSPESPLSYPGRAIKKERGEKGGRHQHSGSVEYGGAAAERGRKKKDPYSQHQRLRNLSNYPEKPGKYSEKLRKKTDLGSRFD